MDVSGDELRQPLAATTETSRLVSNDEFRQTMLPLTGGLEQWVVTWAEQGQTNGFLPAADSKAMCELAAESTWSVPEWRQPVRNAFTYADMLAYALAEHLGAFAAVVHSRVGPAYSHLPTVRAVLEAVPIAHWLFDPDIGPAARIKRSIAYRLESADQAGRLHHIPGAAADSKRARHACLDYIKEQGWVRSAKAIDGERSPKASQFSRVAFGSEAKGLDLTTWGVTSATQHATWYALQTALSGERLVGGPLDPDGGIAPIVVRSDALTMFGLMCFEGCDAVARARDEIYGWSRPAAMTEAAAELRAFGARMRATAA